MTKKTEHDQIRAILVQAIANICRKGLTYKKNFSIEGLLGITLDDDEIFLLNIKETIHHAGYLISSSRAKQSPLASTPRHVIRGKHRAILPAVTSPISPAQSESSSRIGKRSAAAIEDDDSGRPNFKRTSTEEGPEDLSVKPEAATEAEEMRWNGTAATADDTEGASEITVEKSAKERLGEQKIIIQPLRKRSLWQRSRRNKPRKSIPIRAVPSESQPVFPEQDATDLGHFLSMKPMLRDIDETVSAGSDDGGNGGPGKDDARSNHSAASLQIDMGSAEEGHASEDGDHQPDDDDKGTSRGGSGGGGGGGSSRPYGRRRQRRKSSGGLSQPQVYIDHCIDGELSDALNLTAETDVELSLPGGGSTRGLLAVEETNGTAGYQCGLCEEIFDDQATCRRHMRHRHKTKVSFTCELCGRRFWHQGDYTEHKAVFHEGPGGYPCAHCGKVLLSKRGLKEHTQHHTGDFPYFCTHCSRGFGRKFEYTAHMRKHHPADLIITSVAS